MRKRKRESPLHTDSVKRIRISTLAEQLSDPSSGGDKKAALGLTYALIQRDLENSLSILLDSKQLLLTSKQLGIEIPEIKWQSARTTKFKGDEVSFFQPIKTQAVACVYIKLNAGAERQELAQHLIDHMLPNNQVSVYYLYFAEDDAVYVLNVRYRAFFRITCAAETAMESPAVMFEYIIDTLK